MSLKINVRIRFFQIYSSIKNRIAEQPKLNGRIRFFHIQSSIKNRIAEPPLRMPIVFYQATDSPNCWPVTLVADHLGIKLEVKEVDLMTEENMKPEFLKMNPQHCVPTIDDDGFYLWESRAILTYLVNKHAPNNPLYPSDPKERAVVDRMLYFDIGTLYHSQWDLLITALKGSRDQTKEENLKKVFALLETFLEKTSYVAAKHLTLADFPIFVNLVFAEALLDLRFDEYPNLSAWLQRMKKETPKYKELKKLPFKEYFEAWKAFV